MYVKVESEPLLVFATLIMNRRPSESLFVQVGTGEIQLISDLLTPLGRFDNRFDI